MIPFRATLCLSSLLVAITSASDRWWDGPNSGAAGNGASDGGTATWDTSTANWDQGSGLARAAWNNAGYDTAVFAGAAGTVTLGSAVTVRDLLASVSNYTIRGNQTLTLATGGTPTGATPTISNSSSLTLGGSTLGTVIAGSEGLLKTGAGTLTFRGTAASTFTGGLKIHGLATAPALTVGGRVEVDFIDMANGSSDLLNSGNTLTIASGNFSVKGKNAGGALSQSLNGLNLTGGLAGIIVNHNNSTATTLNLGTVTRNNNASLHVFASSPTAAIIKAGNPNDSTNILGTWATYETGSVFSYARNDGGNNLTAYTGTTAADPTALGSSAGTNYDLGTAAGTTSATVVANTVRLTTTAGTTTLGGTLTTNGLLNAVGGNWTISAGTIVIGADRELVVSAPRSTGMITINSKISQETGFASGLTLSTYLSGGIVLASNQSNYTGATIINGPSAFADSTNAVQIPSLKNSGASSEFGAGSELKLNGAVVQFTANNATATSDRNITISGNSGFFIKNVFTQTLAGTISGNGNLMVDSDFVSVTTPGGKGNLVLAASNTFTGEMLFGPDSKITLAHANALSNATLNLTGNRIKADLTTNNLNYMIGGLKGNANLDLGSGQVSIGNNHQSNSYFGIISGTGSFTKVGNGTQTLTGKNTYVGDTVVSSGVLKIGSVPAQALTGNTAVGALTVTNLSSVANLAIGQAVSGTGIGTGAVIISIDTPTQITLSKANTAAGTTTPLTFAAHTGALPTTTKLVISGGKVEPIGTQTVDTLYFGAVRQAAGTWGATGSGADHIDDAHFAGTAGVVQVLPWSIGSSTLAFGNVTVNDTISLSVTITNQGNASISGSASLGGAPYALVSGTSWNAPAGGTTTVTVSFHPTATGSFPDALTLIGNGLTRTVSLSGNGVAFAAPSPTSTQNYSFDLLAGMAPPATTANIPLTQGSSLTQSFIPHRDAFLTGYTARDSAAPATTQLKTVTIKTYAAQSSLSTVRFEVLRVETGGARTVIATEDFQQKFYNTTYTFTFASPALLNFDTTYEIRLTYVVSDGTLWLYAPSSNYAEGSLPTSGDLWLDLGGAATIPIYSQLTVTADAANRFFYDGDPLSANSTSYGYLFGKLLGIGGVAEKLNFTHPASWGAPSYEIENTAIATNAPAGRTSTVDTLALSGVTEGATFLWVKVGSTVVGCVKQQVYSQRSMKLSYTYVEFPGESNNILKSPAMASDIRAYVSSIYAKANVAIAWQDNGILTHEWDKDGDGQSFEDDYNEVWSPIDDGVIPNQTSVFSNVFMVRYDKDDATSRGGGGGTSRGLGEIPPPANGAMVRCTLNRDAASLGGTLAHEIGHNCGLSHTNFGNNMMDVGVEVDNLAGWQWDQIHNMLQSLPAAICGPVANSTPAPPSGTTGQSYNHTFTASGGTPGYTWALENGSLPPGVTHSGATISGTPTLAGTYNFTLRVTDSTTACTTTPFSITISLSETDTNGNGIPDAWEDQWFGNHNIGANPPNADPDGDGLANLIEFATGTNPTVFSASPVTQSVVSDAGSQYLQLSAPRNPAAVDYTFMFLFSSDFQSWAPGVVVATEPNVMVRDTIPIGTSPGRRFGRLQVLSPNP